MGNPKALSWETIRPASVPGTRPPPARLLHDALRAAPAFERFVGSAVAADEPILLLVNDAQRSTQTRATLLALAEFMRDRPRSPRYRVIVATGVHRFSADQRCAFEAATFAEAGVKLDDVTWHDATAPDMLAELAGSRLNKRLIEHRYLLPIGSVEPHYFAGATGAHKTVTVGCLAHADIERNHAAALEPTSDVLRLHGNPVFDGIAAMVRAWQHAGKRICALNQIVRGAELVAAAVGDPLETLDVLLPTVRQLYAHTTPEPADVLHLRVPLPLGCSLYQADKALKNNQGAVRDGGGILLEADCPEGVGPAAFMNLLRRAADYKTARRIVKEQGYRLGDHKAVKLHHLTDPSCRGVHVALVSPHVTPAEAKVAGMRVFDHLEPARSWLATVVGEPFEHGLLVEDAGFITVALSSRHG